MKGIEFKALVETTDLKPDKVAELLEISRMQLYRLYKSPKVKSYYVARINEYKAGNKQSPNVTAPKADFDKEIELLEMVVKTQKDTIEILKLEVERLKAENTQLQTYANQKSTKKQR